MKSEDATYPNHRLFSKISQWILLTISLIMLQLIAGGPFMPHTAAFAALIAALVSMVLMVIFRFTKEILSFLSIGGVLLGFLFILGLLYGGLMIAFLAAIVVLGGGRWVGILVPDITLFSGQYWILILAFAFEIGMAIWNLDFITRVIGMLHMTR